MQKKLRELIQEARRELRRASGVPLTPEEQAEELRRAELARMENFLFEALRIRIMDQLLPKVIWTDSGVIAQFTVDNHDFRLRNRGENYCLSDIEGNRERELLKMHGSDKDFAHRLLVAIGDALAGSE